jgi:hypothetical protein
MLQNFLEFSKLNHSRRVLLNSDCDERDELERIPTIGFLGPNCLLDLAKLHYPGYKIRDIFLLRLTQAELR